MKKLWVLVLFAFLIIIFFPHNKEEKATLENPSFVYNDFRILINGDYFNYLTLNDSYEELGAKAYDGFLDISHLINVSYYFDGHQVSFVDTSVLGSYVVKYSVSLNGKSVSSSRVVIIEDIKGPSLKMPGTVTIDTNEAYNFNPLNGVTSSGDVTCDNTVLAKEGSYVVSCTALDKLGNVKKSKRLVKVISGIDFVYNGMLTIKFPLGDYSYYYSTDGISFKEASLNETVSDFDVVIARVYSNGKLVMTNTYNKRS